MRARTALPTVDTSSHVRRGRAGAWGASLALLVFLATGCGQKSKQAPAPAPETEAAKPDAAAKGPAEAAPPKVPEAPSYPPVKLSTLISGKADLA